MTTAKVGDMGFSPAREPLRRFSPTESSVTRVAASVLIAAAVLVFPLTLYGQSFPVETRPADSDSSYICVLRNEDADAFNYVRREPGSQALGKASANIVVTFVSETMTDRWPDMAKDALNYAAGIWAGIVTSQIAIRIEASWTDLGSCDGSQFALASAGPQLIHRNFRNAPKQDTWYPDAVADALHGADLGAGKIDIVAKFNRSCGASGSNRWYLGIDGRPPAGTIDIASVALHEFAHGLGLFGSADVDDGQSSNGNECNGTDGVGCIGTGNTNNPLAYDRFTEDGNGVSLLSLSNPSAVLGTALEGERAGGIFFSGPELTSAGFSPARLYAPSTFNSGASYAHVDENTYNRTPEALMTPFIARAEAIHVPGALLCGILADVGWTITGDCSNTTTTVQLNDELPESMSVTGPYPNPVQHEATLTVTMPFDQEVRIDVFDTLGRIMGSVYRGVLQSGSPQSFTLDGSAYPPGVYFVAVSGPAGSTTRKMVITM